MKEEHRVLHKYVRQNWPCLHVRKDSERRALWAGIIEGGRWERNKSWECLDVGMSITNMFSVAKAQCSWGQSPCRKNCHEMYSFCSSKFYLALLWVSSVQGLGKRQLINIVQWGKYIRTWIFFKAVINSISGSLVK